MSGKSTWTRRSKIILCDWCKPHDSIQIWHLGASPRGSLALFKTSQALAALRGRDYVLPDDVKTMVPLDADASLAAQAGKRACAVVRRRRLCATFWRVSN